MVGLHDLQDVLGKLRQLSVPELLSHVKSLEEQLAWEGDRHAAVEMSYKDELARIHRQLREQREGFLSEAEKMKTSHAAEKKKQDQLLKGMICPSFIVLFKDCVDASAWCRGEARA
jgi:hypothetical protein